MRTKDEFSLFQEHPPRTLLENVVEPKGPFVLVFFYKCFYLYFLTFDMNVHVLLYQLSSSVVYWSRRFISR